jgi:hypothetical protein
MIAALRYTALRISDVVKLERTRVQNGAILLYTHKNGKPVYLDLHPELRAALAALPIPKGTVGNSEYFFWSGQGTLRAAIRGAERTLLRVFKHSGVKNAHAHRFRHTLATEILAAGGTFEDAADVLGSSPGIVRKHYAQWSVKRQERLSSLLQGLWSDTNLTHAANLSVNDSKEKTYLVDGMGFECMSSTQNQWFPRLTNCKKRIKPYNRHQFGKILANRFGRPSKS